MSLEDGPPSNKSLPHSDSMPMAIESVRRCALAYISQPMHDDVESACACRNAEMTWRLYICVRHSSIPSRYHCYNRGILLAREKLPQLRLANSHISVMLSRTKQEEDIPRCMKARTACTNNVTICRGSAKTRLQGQETPVYSTKNDYNTASSRICYPSATLYSPRKHKRHRPFPHAD